MSKRNNWEDFKNILEQHHITTLYHFTDRDNLENIWLFSNFSTFMYLSLRRPSVPREGCQPFHP